MPRSRPTNNDVMWDIHLRVRNVKRLLVGLGLCAVVFPALMLFLNPTPSRWALGIMATAELLFAAGLVLNAVTLRRDRALLAKLERPHG